MANLILILSGITIIMCLVAAYSAAAWWFTMRERYFTMFVRSILIAFGVGAINAVVMLLTV